MHDIIIVRTLSLVCILTILFQFMFDRSSLFNSDLLSIEDQESCCSSNLKFTSTSKSFDSWQVRLIINIKRYDTLKKIDILFEKVKMQRMLTQAAELKCWDCSSSQGAQVMVKCIWPLMLFLSRFIRYFWELQANLIWKPYDTEPLWHICL